MKTIHKIMALTLITFLIFFALSTLVYREEYPAIISLKVVRYGFPMMWLETRTVVLPPSPTQYRILWFELLIDIIFYSSLSLGTSYIALRAGRRRRTWIDTSLWRRLLLVVSVAYITKLLSCGIHEALGHGLWAWIFGADRIDIHVSWLGFGWCRWQGIDDSLVAKTMAMAGGLLNTSIIGLMILIVLFLKGKKGGFNIRLFLFCLGFWATIAQAGYLLLGGFAGKGDPGSLHSLIGVPLSLFALLGFVYFLVIYPVISMLFLTEVSGLFPEYSKKMLLFVFWLTIPLQTILVLVIDPIGLQISLETSLLLIVVSMVPSLLSLLFFRVFSRRVVV